MTVEVGLETVSTDLPPPRKVSFAADVATIAERARDIMTLSDQERNTRLAVHGLYMADALDSNTLRYAANLAHQAMIARIAGRQMLTGNRLIAYQLQADDIIVAPGLGRNVLLGNHYLAGSQAGKLAVGNEIHFATNGPRNDLYDTMAYLAITAPGDDHPTGLHVGIPYERLELMRAIERDQASSALQHASQITAPAGAPVFSL